MTSLKGLRDDDIVWCVKCGLGATACSASFLRIGFDTTRSTAATHLTYHCGQEGRCGGSFSVYLKKRNGEWEVVNSSQRR